MLHCNLPAPSFGATGGRGSNHGAIRVKARSAAWELHDNAPPPSPLVDPGVRDVLLESFSRSAIQGSLWTSIMLWGDGSLVMWSPGGEKLRSAARGLMARSLLRRALVAPTTRDFHLATAGGRRKPLSVMDLHDAFFRIFAATTVTQSLVRDQQIFALDNESIHERSWAAAKGNVAAISDAAAACRRAAEQISNSCLPENPCPTAFELATAEVSAMASRSDEPVGAVYRSV